MKTSGLASWLPPTRLHACLFGMGIGCAIGMVCAFIMGVPGCTSKPAPQGVTYTTRADGSVWACAPGPEVVP